MKLISGAKHAALQTLHQRTVRDLEAAAKTAAERLATITRLRAELEQLREAKPDAPVRAPLPAQGDAELRRRLNLAHRTIRDQGVRLDELQASHIADTRELHDLRQGATS